jgi:ligand-binding sensor domain-containing protein
VPDPSRLPPSVLDTFNVGPEVFVRALAIDETTGSLWVGTSVGVLEIDLSSNALTNTFTRDDPLASEYVFAIFVDSDGYKWFGTNAGGASRYRAGDWQVFFPRHGLADYWVYAFAQQNDTGPLWIGTWAGANRVDIDTLDFEIVIDELVNEWVYGIGVDSADRVWFATEGGVSMLDGADWRHWTHADGLGAPNSKQLAASSNTGLGTRTRHDLSVLMRGEDTYNPSYVFSIAVDDDDRVWAGTWGGGVSVYDGSGWQNYTIEHGLAGNIVYSISIDDSGARWFGTNHGLTRYDGVDWVTYDVSSGLVDEHVYAIVTAANGDVWAATKGGVARIGYAGRTR